MAGGIDTTTDTTFSYTALGAEKQRSSSTTATGVPAPQTQSVDSTYDPAGRTKRVDNTGDGAPADVDYLYDASGQVIARTAGGKTTYLFYFASGSTLAEETRPSGAIRTRYFNSSTGQVLAEQRFTDVNGEPDQTTSDWVWLLRDPDANVATELEDDGTVAAQRAYDPYGSPDEGGSSKLPGEKESALGYQSAQTDEDTGNLLLGPRIYDPSTDRFTTADSFVAGGADMALGTDPLTGNRYVFAAANPVAFFENGYEPCPKGSNCNYYYSGPSDPKNRRPSGGGVDGWAASSAGGATYGGAEPTLAGCQSLPSPTTIDYLSGSQCPPSNLDYSPEFRDTAAGPRFVDPAGECSWLIDTGPAWDFRGACDVHDYGWDLVRANAPGVIKSEVDNLFYADMLTDCGTRGWLGGPVCRHVADAAHIAVRNNEP